MWKRQKTTKCRFLKFWKRSFFWGVYLWNMGADSAGKRGRWKKTVILTGKTHKTRKNMCKTPLFQHLLDIIQNLWYDTDKVDIVSEGFGGADRWLNAATSPGWKTCWRKTLAKNPAERKKRTKEGHCTARGHQRNLSVYFYCASWRNLRVCGNAENRLLFLCRFADKIHWNYGGWLKTGN